jgi:hypothetical protein
MEELTVEDLKKQHFDSYKENLLSIIENNTNILVNEDIKTLISKPPLDSMDTIKSKFLDLSKKNKIVLKTDELSKLLDNYRNNLSKVIEKIQKERISVLNKKVDSFKYKDGEVLEFYKKDFISLDKVLKKILKDNMIESYEKVFNKGITKIFDKDIDDSIKNKIIEDINKFITKNYQKQILDGFDIKVLVKDTILINSINEHNERYIFVLNNSRLFSIE